MKYKSRIFPYQVITISNLNILLKSKTLFRRLMQISKSTRYQIKNHKNKTKFYKSIKNKKIKLVNQKII